MFYHLEIGFNSKTKLVSILNTVPSKKMFDDNYPYRSSMSKTMLASFKKLSKRLRDSYNPNCILEIGSNDGSLIKNFSANQHFIELNGDTGIERNLKFIHFGDWLSYWCAIRHNTNPTPVKNIDRLKAELKKRQ